MAVIALAVSQWWGWRRLREAEVRGAREREAAREREERLRAEQARDQAGWNAILNRMTEGLLVLDGAGRVRWINEPLRRLFDLPTDVRGRTLIEALCRHELVELADRAGAEGQALGLELEVGSGSGSGAGSGSGSGSASVRVLQVNATTYDDDTGGARGRILVFREITRLKELEGTRRDFVANVSHELRTPLALIKGFVETLLDGARNDPEVALRFLQKIEKHANRLTFLIEDLLTISQLESGGLVMNRQRVPLRSLVARVLDDFAARAIPREVRLLNEVPVELVARVDADRMQQVLCNLVDNAIKYGRVGGRVAVGGRVGEAGGRLELWVEDDGPGIPREALDRVFERFYRVDTARSREQGGTGLGLSIVKHIVQAHGGEVKAESEARRGTVFRILLPREDASGG